MIDVSDNFDNVAFQRLQGPPDQDQRLHRADGEFRGRRPGPWIAVAVLAVIVVVFVAMVALDSGAGNNDGDPTEGQVSNAGR